MHIPTTERQNDCTLLEGSFLWAEAAGVVRRVCVAGRKSKSARSRGILGNLQNNGGNFTEATGVEDNNKRDDKKGETSSGSAVQKMMSKEAAFLHVAEDTDGGEGGPMLFPEFVEALARLCLARYGPLAPVREISAGSNIKKTTARGRVARGGRNLPYGGGTATRAGKVGCPAVQCFAGVCNTRMRPSPLVLSSPSRSYGRVLQEATLWTR